MTTAMVTISIYLDYATYRTRKCREVSSDASRYNLTMVERSQCWAQAAKSTRRSQGLINWL